MVTQRSQLWSWMIDSHPFCTKSISPPIPEIRLFQTLTLKFQGQGHGCGQSAQPYNWPSILLDLFSFCFTSIRSQYLRYSYFEVWPSKIQDQRHGWSQRSRSHSWPRIQPMHLLFVPRHRTNHSWDLSNSVWPCKNTTAILKKKLTQQILFNRIPPKCNQIMSIIWGHMAKIFVLIGWVVVALSCRQPNFC